MPIYLQKNHQLAAPQVGQKEFELFEKWSGRSWNSFTQEEFDPETKITEFEYEKFLPAELLKHIDTADPNFIKLVRFLNFTSKTRIEEHEANQE